jgi:hypothetical protein
MKFLIARHSSLKVSLFHSLLMPPFVAALALNKPTNYLAISTALITENK